MLLLRISVEKNDNNKILNIKAARKAGKYLGRKTIITKKLIDLFKYLKETKNLSITPIAKITGRARSTIYKILKQELNSIPYNRLVKQ